MDADSIRSPVRNKLGVLTPAVQSSAPPNSQGELDRHTLHAARTFDMLLRNGQNWRGVRLVKLDTWSLLLVLPGQGRAGISHIGPKTSVSRRGHRTAVAMWPRDCVFDE